MQRHAALFRALRHASMEQRPANPIANAIGKASLNALLAVNKTDAAKARCLAGIEANIQRGQGGQPVGHDALSTSLINRWPRAVDHGYLEACLPGSDSGCETGRSPAGHQNFCFPKVPHATTAVEPTQRRNQDPWPRGCYSCPAPGGGGS